MSDSDDAVLAVAPAAVRRPRPPHRRATAASRGRRASSSESPVGKNFATYRLQNAGVLL